MQRISDLDRERDWGGGCDGRGVSHSLFDCNGVAESWRHDDHARWL
jgi:hypothetical protein